MQVPGPEGVIVDHLDLKTDTGNIIFRRGPIWISQDICNTLHIRHISSSTEALRKGLEIMPGQTDADTRPSRRVRQVT